VTLYKADLSETAVPRFESPPCTLVDRSRFDAQLVQVATKAGAEFFPSHRASELSLGESDVTVRCDERSFVGKLLILASGRGTPLYESLRLGSVSMNAQWWASQVESDSSTGRDDASIGVVLGLDSSGGFGYVVVADGRVTVNVQTCGPRETVVGTITHLCRNLVLHDVIGTDLSSLAARSEVVAIPPSVALSMETHVGKRSVVIGDAGGFVSAASGEGIYPAMWSGKIAAEVVGRAVAASSPQDVLMEFNTAWRTEMADYLRPPNTDVQYILPLVFSNQPMADRMGAAFFSGVNI
jgi:flavin-dependent dehydrogenase